MIYELFSSLGPKKKFFLNIAIFVGTFCLHNKVYQAAHSRTHTHTLEKVCMQCEVWKQQTMVLTR